MTANPIRRFWNVLKQYSSELRQIYVYALFIGVVNLTLPLGIQSIISFLQTGELTSTWVILVAFVLIGMAITGVLQILQLRIVENIQQDLFARSAFEFAYRIPEITFIQLDKIHAPELVNRFFDTLTIQKGLPKILIDFSLATFQIVFGLILLTIYSPYFIILGLVLAVILWLIFKVTGPDGLLTSLKESKRKYELVHWLEGIARVSRTFKLYGQSKLHLEKTDRIVSNYLIFREKHFQVLINQFKLFIGFKIVLAAGLILLGGFLVFKEEMNIGQFVASEIVIILIINSVEKVLKTIDTIYDVLTALEKIGYVTDLQLDENTGHAGVGNTKGVSVKVDNIRFGFPEEKNKVFDGLSLDIKSGEKIVLEGSYGSGKSVLLQVLAGIHRHQEGEIYVNNIPFSNYEKSELQDSFGVVFPTNQIFEGTFRENILLGRNISDEKLNEVIDLLGMGDFISHQMRGMDSFVDSGGRRLPRTIIQKVLIARIIINEPKLILLESPLQAIQKEERKKIIDYLTDEERGWTLIVISDFDYWKSKCNRSINLDKV